MILELLAGFALGRLTKSNVTNTSYALCAGCGSEEHANNVLARLGTRAIPFCAYCCNKYKPNVGSRGEITFS